MNSENKTRHLFALAPRLSALLSGLVQGLTRVQISEAYCPRIVVGFCRGAVLFEYEGKRAQMHILDLGDLAVDLSEKLFTTGTYLKDFVVDGVDVLKVLEALRTARRNREKEPPLPYFQNAKLLEGVPVLSPEPVLHELPSEVEVELRTKGDEPSTFCRLPLPGLQAITEQAFVLGTWDTFIWMLRSEWDREDDLILLA